MFQDARMSGSRPHITVDLFGPPHLEAGGKRLGLSSRKAMGLLAYLAMRGGRPASRPHLASLLWPDNPEDQGRTNLRQSLTQLRKLFRDAGIDPIEAGTHEVMLRLDGLDIPAIGLAGELPDSAVIGMAGGPAFLEGFTLQVPDFEDWVLAERRTIEARLEDGLARIAARAEEAGDLSTASAAVARALKLNPLNEALHRRQMALLARLGRAGAALAQFETCKQLLRGELDVEPEPETRELAARIRAERAKPKAKAEAARPTEPEMDTSQNGAAILFVREASGHIRHEQFADAGLALSAAMTAAAGNGQRARVAVTEDTGDMAQAHRQAETLLEKASGKAPLVTAAIADGFDHTSAFGFTAVEGAPGEPACCEVTHMVRHRLQVGHAVNEPVRRFTNGHALIVLPFRDMSPNAEEFSLGLVLAEEISARLSRFGTVTVASPTAAQTCRQLNLDAKTIRAKMGVDYLVDGSLFRMGERLRITATITDLRDDRIVSSERFDGPFDQIFQFQSDLVDRISSSIAHNMESAEISRVESALTSDMGAFDWYLRALSNHRRAGLRIDNARTAFRQFNNAIDLDPAFARAYAWRVCAVSWYDTSYVEEGRGGADVAYALSVTERDPEVHRIAGSIAMVEGDYDRGMHHVERAVELNPSDAYLLATSAIYWSWYGAPENGLKHMDRAMELDPFLPVWAVEDHGIMLYSMEDYEGALKSLGRLAIPQARSLAFAAAADVALGNVERARQTVARLKKYTPHYTADQLRLLTYYRDPARTKALFDRLKTAGLD